MAATSDEGMESLLSDFDQIHEDFKRAISEVQLLRSSCNAETKRREALEITCNTLKKENERARNSYTESLENLADQLERKAKCQSLKEELKRVNDEHLSKEYELRKVIDSMKQDYAAKARDFEDQIRSLMLEKATNEATISNLHQDLAAHKMHMQTLAKRLDQVKFDVEMKYNLEIQDLKDCLLLEQEEKNELNKRVQDLEKELLMNRTKMAEHNRDLTSVRSVETLKLKIMKLRKENEILKRKLNSSSQEG
ncbi:hypothetical protein CICLE_v10010167mg [Citrus x clementina]|uniref:Protein At-4/1 n=1 Tax=Citrus clementina TaxID=85681 RepID=V4WIB4_CITCL|nr:protein At-4/1 [Citrus x clementina]XP_006474645.1 protein At-4/1 [Citrus sinensis]ESR66474.1 hypothetical protein CICLE_v10010167mg [Citrus x clementina]